MLKNTNLNFFSHFKRNDFISHYCAFSIIFIFLVILFIHGFLNSFIPCEKDCGETFIALHQASNLYITGAKFCWLEDLATSPNIANHPYLYTHSINIGNLVFVLAEQLGLSALWQKQMITLAITGLGLLYIYLCVLKAGKNSFIALLTLFLFSISYNQVFSFGLNALRAWHWLALFGSLYHTQNLLENFTLKNSLLMTLFSFISFCLGYDFWIIVFISCLLLSVFSHFGHLRTKRTVLLFLCGCFIAPFCLRQIQVYTVLGFDYWMTDFHYTFLSKVPLVTKFFRYPSSEEIKAFYEHYNILRPYSLPESSILSIWGTFSWMFSKAVYPNYGLVNCGAIVFSSIFCIKAIRNNTKEKESTHDSKLPALYLSILLGTMIGLFVFSPFSFHVYLKHEFPLLGAVFYLSISLSVFAIRQYTANIKLNYCILVFFVLNTLMVQVQNIKNRSPMDTSWINFASTHKQNTYAVSWINSCVSSFSENWVLPLIPGSESQILSNLQNKEAPFDKKMTLNFGEKDKEQSWNIYSKPDFWLYFDANRLPHLDQGIDNGNSIDKIINLFPQFPVFEKTKNYVVFDLRDFWKR